MACIQARSAIDIDVQGGIIETEGDTSHGVYGLHQGSEGDIRIETMEAAISMMGANAHGIYAEHVSGMGETEIIVGEGTTVRADGAGASGFRHRDSRHGRHARPR